MRLDKFISSNTHYSRSDARKLIKAGRIAVNGEPVAAADTSVKSKKDVISLDGVRIEPIGEIYLMVNKPEGYVCANEDGEHPTIIDLLRDEANFVGARKSPLPLQDLQIAGRLDIDTTGLVLVTNDGQWNHAITSPAADCKKNYRVSLKQPLDPSVPERFAKGIQLEGEKRKTRPAFVHVITPKKVRLSLSEGKYHQVKRMFAATGNGVKKLHRESIGGVFLDKTLKPGQYRLLTEQELDIIKRNTERGI